MPHDDEHQYDYAYTEENGLSNRRRESQERQLSSNEQEVRLETIQNPYYEGGNNKNLSGSEDQPGTSSVVHVKVTHNPYYAM